MPSKKELKWIEKVQKNYQKTHPYTRKDLFQDAWMMSGGLLLLGYMFYMLCQLMLKLGS